MQSVMAMMRKTQQFNQNSITKIDEEGFKDGGVFNQTTNFYGDSEFESRLSLNTKSEKRGRSVLLPIIEIQQKFNIKGSNVDET